MSIGPVRNPLHRLIDLLTRYESAHWQVHHAQTPDERRQALLRWRACHRLAWQGWNGRDEAIRRLADPAKSWLSNSNSRHIDREDFNLIEECAFQMTGFAVSPCPMSIPELYSELGTSRGEIRRNWDRQDENYFALRNLVSRLRELAARAGETWAPCPPAEGSEDAGRLGGPKGPAAAGPRPRKPAV
jgi:hypothetical protein